MFRGGENHKRAGKNRARGRTVKKEAEEKKKGTNLHRKNCGSDAVSQDLAVYPAMANNAICLPLGTVHASG